MQNILQHDIYNIYQIESGDFTPQNKWKSLLLNLAKISMIFVFMTMVIFFIVNYQFIKYQLVGWFSDTDRARADFKQDTDNDGISDWWELEKGMNINDPKDARQDRDGDLLIALLEYRYQTDPFNEDTDGDGYPDGKEVINGFDPNGVGRIDRDKDGIFDWWEDLNGLDKTNYNDAQEDFDADGLSNIMEYQYLLDPRNPDTDGDGVLDGNENLDEAKNFKKQNMLDKDGDGLKDYYEELFGTDKNNPDTDGDGFDDYREISRGYDPTGEGMVDAMIDIPAIGIKAPIIWSQKEDSREINKELENGVIHYPETTFPMMRGNSYITGHSSYYTWVKSDYKEVFKDIHLLKDKDEVIIHIKLKNGKSIDAIYEVSGTGEVVLPNDERLFRDYEGYEMTLVTCWPLGTNWKRMMFKAYLKSPVIKDL